MTWIAYRNQCLFGLPNWLVRAYQVIIRAFMALLLDMPCSKIKDTLWHWDSLRATETSSDYIF